MNVSINELSHMATSSTEAVYKYSRHRNFSHNQNRVWTRYSWIVRDKRESEKSAYAVKKAQES